MTDTPHITNNYSTIFKTYIKDLQNVQSIINSISNVEVWANGATGLLNANSLNSLKTAISGLSKEQALLVLSTKNLSKAQTEQVLSAAGLLNVEKQLSVNSMCGALTFSVQNVIIKFRIVSTRRKYENN